LTQSLDKSQYNDEWYNTIASSVEHNLYLNVLMIQSHIWTHYLKKKKKI